MTKPRSTTWSRGYGWGRRLILAATLGATLVLMAAMPALAVSSHKYMW
jgi:hypothetical protein